MYSNRLVTGALFASLIAGASCAQVEPGAGQWRTWVVPAVSQLRVSPPPDQEGTQLELAELRDMATNRSGIFLDQITYWDAGAPAYRWMQIASQEISKRNVPAPLATRAMAAVAVAIYDATVAAWDSKYTYVRPRPSDMDPTFQPAIANPRTPSYPSEHAVAAGAASTGLGYLFPDAADRFNALAADAARSRLIAGVEFPTDSATGLDLGRRVGAMVAAYAAADRSDTPFTGSFPPAPGKWSSANPVQPLAGTWRPWVLTSGSQLRPGPPPPFDSPDAAAQVAAVKGFTRTVDTNRTAWIWQASFITPWVDTLHQKVFEYRLDLNAPRAARAYALAMIAQHDATIACWDTKYTFLEMRPVMADSTITTLFPTPSHPSFPSGHACASGGTGAVLGYLFPTEAQSFADRATEAGQSTFDAGIHYPIDVDGGLVLGRAVAQQVITRARQDGSE